MFNVLRNKLRIYWKKRQERVAEIRLCLSLSEMLRAKVSEADGAESLARMIENVSEEKGPKEALRFLLTLDKFIYLAEGKAAIRYGEGVHPKHRITRYHHFFIDHIKEGDRILEIGSGK